nr:hypothetical protein [Tanacetum cinerariifolium]
MEIHNIKQREGESVRDFAARYTDDTWQILGLHEDQRISGFVHGLKARNLVEHLSIYLLSTYKGLIEKTYTWIEAREVTTNGALNDQRDNFERGPNYIFLSILSKIPRDIITIEKLRSQIEEAVRSSQLSHLVKGIKKERTKTSDSQRGEKKDKSTTPAEAPILMINQEDAHTKNIISKSSTIKGKEITFPQLQRVETPQYRKDINAENRNGSLFSIHKAVKFPTTQGIGTMFSTHESDKIKGVKKVRETSPANTKGVLSCTDAE